MKNIIYLSLIIHLQTKTHKMKKVLLFIFLIANQFVYSQCKTFKVQGCDYFKFNSYNNFLFIYENYHDSLKETSYKIYDDVVKTAYKSDIIKVIDDDESFHSIKLSELDTKLNLFEEIKNKTFLINKPDEKDFYYVKGDSVLIHETLHKYHVWYQEKYQEHKIFKIDLGKNRIIYWADGLGIIFKENGILKTNFTSLKDFYHHENELSNKPNDYFKTELDYCDFGVYKVKQKRNTPTNEVYYSVTKDNKTVVKKLNLKYYNDKKLIAYGNHSLKFYGLNLKLDSQFYYRALSSVSSNEELEFLIKNNIKKVSYKGYNTITTCLHAGSGVCGMVTRFSLKIVGKKLEYSYPSYGDKHFTKNISIQNPIQFDSMLFINQEKEISWTSNGGFDGRILIYNKG